MNKLDYEKTVSEEVLIRLFEERSEDALRLTEARYAPALRRFASRLLCDERDREEAVSDALLAAWQAIPPHRPRSLPAFLTMLTRRAAIRLLRQHSRRREVPRDRLLALEELEEVLPDRTETEDSLMAQELARSLEAFLTAQPARSREIFLSRYYDSLPVGEIAERLHLSRSTVEKELKKARGLLRDHLRKEGYEV